jgi:predicted GNAT superfamily acetyltransferase
VRIEELTDIAAQHDVAALLQRIWQAPVVDASTLHAMSHVGNYVSGVYDDKLVGAAVGFFAADGHLHSHVAGVAPEYQGRGIGFALKRHQRDWALARGRTEISWTFDPLIARNAYFNMHKLGAAITEYLPDFYGPMHDAINAGDAASDRLFVLWHLDRPVAPAPTGSDATVLLDREGDLPVPGVLKGDRATVATPPDVERMRSTDLQLAIRWRMAVREALASALDAGYQITGISRDGRYFLEAT